MSHIVYYHLIFDLVRVSPNFGFHIITLAIASTNAIAAIRVFTVCIRFRYFSITSIVGCYCIGFHVDHFLLSIVVIIVVIFIVIIVSNGTCAVVIYTVIGGISQWLRIFTSLPFWHSYGFTNFSIRLYIHFHQFDFVSVP